MSETLMLWILKSRAELKYIKYETSMRVHEKIEICLNTGDQIYIIMFGIL